ncbi:MAG: hypothetical protein ACQEXJ_22040 [Myxococcota bacterium]
MVGRGACWTLLFYGLVEWPLVTESVYFRGAWPGIPWRMLHFLAYTPWLTIVALLVWLVAAELLVVRRRALRGVVFMGLPVALLYALLVTFYHVSLPQASPTELERQAGVRVVLDARALPEEAAESWRYPRAVVVDEDRGAAWASLGQTLGSDHTHKPNVWRIPLDGGSPRFVRANQVRALAAAPGTDRLVYAPWFEHAVVVASRTDLDVVARVAIDPQRLALGRDSEPTSAVAAGSAVLVAYNANPTLLRVDTRSPEETAVVNLPEEGISRQGDQCCSTAPGPDPGTVLVGGGHVGGGFVTLLDVDTLEPLWWAPSPTLPSSLAVSTVQPDLAYLTSDVTGRLLVLDMGERAVRDVCSIPFQSTVSWDEFRDELVLVDYIGGTVRILGPDCVEERRWDVGPKPRAVAATASGLYAVSAAGLVFIDRPGAGDREHLPKRADTDVIGPLDDSRFVESGREDADEESEAMP